jgi:DNA-binding NarL/FixJ family response regulator
MATKPSRSVVRVLIVEDFEPFRRFVCTTLREKTAWKIVAEAADGLHAVQKAKELEPDLILLDIGLPTLNGIEVAERISTLVRDAKIIFVTQNNDPDVMSSALSNGAHGYVLKAHAKRELVPAVEAVLEGGRFLGSGVSEREQNLSSSHRAVQ